MLKKNLLHFILLLCDQIDVLRKHQFFGDFESVLSSSTTINLNLKSIQTSVKTFPKSNVGTIINKWGSVVTL